MPITPAPDDLEAQLADLGSLYGPPQRVQVVLSGGPFDPLDAPDRYGEICMVLRRPHGTLLTAIKTFYPSGSFRLLTGGVQHGELIHEALLREVAEETSLQVRVQRFLAAIEYRLPQPGQPDWHFATFAFVLDEIGGELAMNDPDEHHAAFREISIAELPQLAANLEAVPDQFDPRIRGVWRDWGRFRAVVHRVVHPLLTTEPPHHDD
jgi:ADP-ribose pyrophosphatase YjhB (NUDIX family)